MPDGAVALGLTAWSQLVPRPLPVVVAMSVGQLLGTVAFVAFLSRVAADRRHRERS